MCQAWVPVDFVGAVIAATEASAAASVAAGLGGAASGDAGVAGKCILLALAFHSLSAHFLRT